jgi:hypothetical protein
VDVATEENKEETFIKLIYNQYVARIIEGCNAISIIILFISFLFSGKLNQHYFIFGSVLVYVLNDESPC